MVPLSARGKKLHLIVLLQAMLKSRVLRALLCVDVTGFYTLLCVNVTGSYSEWEGLLTLHIAPAVLIAPLPVTMPLTPPH